MATNTTLTEQATRLEHALKDRALSGIDLETLYTLLPALLNAYRLVQGEVVQSRWQVTVTEAGHAYDHGPEHATLEAAVFYRDNCIEPRRGKRSGYAKNAVIHIFRHDLIKTPEPV